MCSYSVRQDEHDTCLRAALQTIQGARVTLTPEKRNFRRSITIFGHGISEQGITADHSKTQAVIDMERPRNITELRRFMSMANQLGKFSVRLAGAPSQFSHSSALEQHGCGVQPRRMLSSSQSWQTPPHWHCMTLSSPPKSLMMLQHKAWALYYLSNMQTSGSQWPLLPGL